MRPPLLLLALLILCVPAFAEPVARLEQDRAAETSAEIAPGQWFDLLLLVDPKGASIAEEGLKATPMPLGGAEFGAAIFPAPDAPGAFTKPFTVRVPAKLAAAKAYEVAVALEGRTPAGPFETRAQRKLRLLDRDQHLTATASLKSAAVANRANAVLVKATVVDGYHVYGAGTEDGVPTVGMLLPAPGARGAVPWTGGGPAAPQGENLDGTFQFEIPFTPTRAGKVEMRVLVDWQACTEMMCDANSLAYLPLAFDVEGASGAGGAEQGSTGSAPPPPGSVGPAKGSASGGSGGSKPQSLWALVAAAIGAGILALLMPCTYPLIPITISFFTKQAEASHKSVVPLALAYGAGIVAIFTVIGLLVGTTLVASQTVLNIATSWQLNLVFALLFLAFGLSLLGLFDIRLPSFFDNLAAKASGTHGYLSVFIMGLTLVITSFTCTVPFVGGLLVVASKDGELGRAVFAMAVFGLTMAIPFVVLSLSPKGFKALPKSGEWMKRLKVTLGIIELGLVLKFVSNVDIAKSTFFIGREMFLVLWAFSFLAAGLYLLGVFDLFARGVRWTCGGGRAIAGLVMLGITAVLSYGATGPGLDEVVGPRAGALIESFLPQFKADYGRAFLAVTSDYDEGIRIAREKNAPIFLHFTGYT